MELTTGQEVWLAFSTASNGVGGTPYASVERATVIDGEHRVLRRENGRCTICQTWSVEHPHPTEAAAWAACADELERFVGAVEAKAQECRQAAAQSAARAAVEVTA